jgi:gluconate 2-dehydrogenase gamma chain
VDPGSSSAVLTRAETQALEAVLARLIPSDEHGAGAAEAGVRTYIERALAAERESFQRIYSQGLRELDAQASARHGTMFADLETPEQDALLLELEGTAFFETVREHALQGMFGDPAYGGNVALAGWDLLGFPGVRASVPAEDQALDTVVTTTRTARGDLPLRGGTG